MEDEKIEQSIELPEEPEVDATLAHAVSSIPDIWGASGSRTKQLANIQRSRGILGTVHGMYAGVPMICKGTLCPFAETCWIPAADRVVGDRCPIEIATILEQYENYCKQLEVAPDNTVDQGLVKQLIDIEITMLRADNKMASDPDILREVVDAISQKTGDVYFKQEVNPVLALKSDLRKEHHRILTNLQATRKDKKDQLLGLQDPSSMAAKLIQRARQLNQTKTVDAEVIESDPSDQREVNEDVDRRSSDPGELGCSASESVPFSEQPDDGSSKV